MEELLNGFTTYLRDALAMRVELAPWDGEAQLPLYLREQYRFYRVKPAEGVRNFLLCMDRAEQTPALIEKNFMQLSIKTQEALVYVRQSITSYDRKRLIERKIPFVIPGNQMYLPFVGIDLRERYTDNRTRSDIAFSPAAQYLILYLLGSSAPMEMNQSNAARLLGYQNMTMVRAFREIESAGIGSTEKVGKEKCLKILDTRRKVWERIEPRMQNPVMRRVYVRGLDQQTVDELNLAIAGESALARVSMLNEPRVPVWAIQSKTWQSQKGGLLRKLQELPYAEAGSAEIQLWRYPVLIPDQRETVDPLSLYLSLRDRTDERLQDALSKLLEKTLW
jgi:hypothetical protein